MTDPHTLDIPIEALERAEEACRNPYEWWQMSLAGKNPPIHENTPQCGYFKIRDRRGLYKDKAPIKRPFIACAIWLDADGNFKAEIAKEIVSLESAWPWFAKHTITYEDYTYWHTYEKWPEKEVK